jgi:hypothetical protein
MNLCMHRYFTNEPGEPQRMELCYRETGHEGECGPGHERCTEPRNCYCGCFVCHMIRKWSGYPPVEVVSK